LCCRIPDAGATPPGQDPRTRRDLALEQRGEVLVTSVDTPSEDLWPVPAAASLITADDIRRSSATSLPNPLAPHHLEVTHAPGPSAGVARSIVVRATWTRPDR